MFKMLVGLVLGPEADNRWAAGGPSLGDRHNDCWALTAGTAQVESYAPPNVRRANLEAAKSPAFSHLGKAWVVPTANSQT